MLRRCFTLMLVSRGVTRMVAYASCPDLSTVRSDFIKESFNVSKISGLWYEHAYEDVAQVGSTCQTETFVVGSNASLPFTGKFSVKYGKIPFTIQENFQPNLTVSALYVKTANVPGGKFIKLPTVVVDAASKEADGLYNTLTQYSCADGGLDSTYFYTRSPVVDAAVLSQMEATAKALGARWTKLKNVNWTDCRAKQEQSRGMEVSASDQLLKPLPGKSGPAIGMIMIQGAQIPSMGYVPLAQAIQNASEFKLYVAIPGFPLDTPEPPLFSSTVSRALKSLSSAGLDTSAAPLVMAAHSLGTVFTQSYVAQQASSVAAQILMGGALLRTYDTEDFPVATLTLDGTLDGLYRPARQAESYHRYISLASNASQAIENFPHVMYEGVSHMQFASGVPPALVEARDLRPSISYDAAHKLMAASISNFLDIRLGSGAEKAAGLQEMTKEVDATGIIVQPFLDALELEAFKHFKPPCDSDGELPSFCPFYPRYPGSQTSSTPQSGCYCGTPWVEANAQSTLGGLDDTVTVLSTDAIHPVSDINPVHLPHIWTPPCNPPHGTGDQSCTINATSVTYPLYASLDAADTGFAQIAALELRVKLVSRQAMYEAVGRKDVNFTLTDVIPSLCALVNQKSYQYALQHASQAALQRYGSVGQQLVMGADVFIGNAGPLWIENPLTFTPSADKKTVAVTAPCSHTPTDYSIKSAAGFHYCKLLSPARALEWIYTDGLRQFGGLNSTSTSQ